MHPWKLPVPSKPLTPQELLQGPKPPAKRRIGPTKRRLPK